MSFNNNFGFGFSKATPAAGGVVPSAWDITSGAYSGKSFTHPSVTILDFLCSDDGKYMYIAPQTSFPIEQWEFGTVGDISTLTDTGNRYAITGTILGLGLSSDGINLYIAGNPAEGQLVMSTPFDLSTATFTTGDDNASLSYSCVLNDDGTYMFGNFTKLARWDLTTPYDVKTMANPVQAPNPGLTKDGMDFHSVFGNQVMYSSNTNRQIQLHSMSTAYDPLTFNTTPSQTMAIGAEITSGINSVWVARDSSVAYVLADASKIYQYDL